MARVGIREVAVLADVSQGTVSHYINHPERVSPAKQERIQQAIDQLGFVRNNAAWQLRLGRSGAIAYIVPDVSNPFFAAVAEGVEQRAAAEGRAVFIANSNGIRAREDAYLDKFEAHRVEGMLVASHEPVEDRLLRIRQRGIPSVLVGQRSLSPEQPSVSIDDVRGGRLAARHLIETGRRRLAFVGGPVGVRQIADRLDGASAESRAAGVALEVIAIEHRTIAGGREAGRMLAARAEHDRPDAIFAANDLLALGLMQSLVERGIRVPGDIAMIGYDDIEFGEASLIPLSSIRAPQVEFGVAAVDILLAEIAGTVGGPRQLVIPPSLVVRASSRPGAGAEPEAGSATASVA